MLTVTPSYRHPTVDIQIHQVVVGDQIHAQPGARQKVTQEADQHFNLRTGPPSLLPFAMLRSYC